jgi:hypothetical protein
MFDGQCSRSEFQFVVRRSQFAMRASREVDREARIENTEQ